MSLTRKFLDELSSTELIERLDLALEGADLGIWDWDLRDNSVQFDRRWCTMLGLVHAETPMVLATWSDRVHPDDLAGCYADIKAHLAGTTTHYQNVHRMRHADGSWRHILDRGRISGRDASGTPIRFTGTHLDVTARHLAEARVRLEQQARLAVLTHMAAMLAHELNTPLQVLLLASNALATARDGTHANVAEQDALETIAEMATRAGRITSALRLLASVREGQRGHDDGTGGGASAEVGVALATARTLFESRLSGLGIRCTIVDHSAAARGRASLAELVRVLVFVLDLAIDTVRAHSPTNREIDIEASATPTHLVVSFRYGADAADLAPGAADGLSPVELLAVLIESFDGKVSWTAAQPVRECVLRIPRVDLVTA